VGLSILAPYALSRYHLNAAEQAIQRYDLEAARAQLALSWSGLPGNSLVLFLRAQTARRLDDCALAERLLTDYERWQGSTEEAKLEWLLLGVQQGDLDNQEGYLRSLVDAGHPSAPLILEALAKGFMNVSRSSRMFAYLDLLLKREPKNALALILRGKGWEARHSSERALEDYQRALELLPASTEGRLRLAETFERLGQIREGVAHFEWLRQRQPGSASVLLGLARCRFDLHELEQARELLDDLLTAQPDNVAALVERGRLALCQGQEVLAEEKLWRAAALAPWHREAHRLLQRCLDAEGKSVLAEKGQAQLHELEDSDRQAGQLSLRFRKLPQDVSVRFEVAMWALHNGREPDGARWLFATLLLDPQHGPTHAALADYFERLGQPRRSAEHRRRAAHSDEKLP
jgi:tetratricopeptide (TPR) repeat protein